MRITARLQEMSANAIADMIPQATFDAIKAVDPHPKFMAFTIGHEGQARGNVVGMGNIVKRWFKSAVEKLHEKVRSGLQLFHGHAATNDQTGRRQIGEIVGKRLLQIDDRLSSVVACYIYPDAGGLSLDVASIEADVELDVSADGVRVINVGELTAIALGSSAIETPGFDHASLLGQLTMFAGEHGGGEDSAIGPDTDMTDRLNAASARSLLGDRTTLTLRDGLVLERMGGGGIVVNGKTFTEMTYAESTEARKLIDDLQEKKRAAERAPYSDPAKNPFLKGMFD